MFTLLIIIIFTLITAIIRHLIHEFNLWRLSDNKAALIKKWIRKDLPIGAFIIIISGGLIHHSTKPETQQEKDKKAYIAFNEAVEPLLKWCQRKTSDTYFGFREFKLLNDDGSIMVNEDVSKCFFDAKFRSKIISDILYDEKKLLSIILNEIGKSDYFNNLNRSSDTNDKKRINDLVLAKKTVSEEGIRYNDSGLSLVCKSGLLIFRGEAIGYTRPLYMFSNKEVESPSEKKCYEIDWISFKKFKPFVDVCWKVGCKVYGYVDSSDNLVGLNVAPSSQLNVLVESRRNLEIKEIKKILSDVSLIISSNRDIDKITWEKTVKRYWKND